MFCTIRKKIEEKNLSIIFENWEFILLNFFDNFNILNKSFIINFRPLGYFVWKAVNNKEIYILIKILTAIIENNTFLFEKHFNITFIILQVK